MARLDNAPIAFVASPIAAAPEGLTWGVHISLASTWFDPSETSGIITPFLVLWPRTSVGRPLEEVKLKAR